MQKEKCNLSLSLPTLLQAHAVFTKKQHTSLPGPGDEVSVNAALTAELTAKVLWTFREALTAKHSTSHSLDAERPRSTAFYLV